MLNLSIRPALSRKIRLNLLVALPFLSVGASSPLASLDREVSDPASVDEAVETPSPPEFELPLAPNRRRSPPLNAVKSLPHGEDLVAQATKGPDGRYYLEREGEQRALTIDGVLQDKLNRTLKDYRTPYAAVVVLEPSTGKILAMAEHSERDPKLRGLTTKAIYPAASIFKIITASALLDAGIKPEDTECFHGGKRRISERLLVDSRRDQTCYTLTKALAKSANVVFAKMTQKHLTPEKLKARALEFFFNRPIAFAIPTDLSLASIPDDPLGFASAGSGFGDVYLSPLHAAAIAAIAANAGVWQPPVLFEGENASEPIQVISRENAEMLVRMMEDTVSEGTARRIFRQRGFRIEGAAGKTGCLADYNPYRDYSWFVGFAPAKAPSVAVAAVVVNDQKWRIRGTWLGREALRLALANQPGEQLARSQ